MSASAEQQLKEAKERRRHQEALVTWTMGQLRSGRSRDSVRATLFKQELDALLVDQTMSSATEIMIDEITDQKRTTDCGWLEAEPWPDVNAATEPPIQSLPSMLRDAVLAISATVQCSEGLAFASVLAGCASAASGAFDVRFEYPGHSLKWPCNELFLTLALSGERKSSASKFIDEPLQEYESELFESMRCQIAQARADAGSWQEKRTGILQAIRQAAKKSDDEGMRIAKSALHEHEQRQPDEPLVPRLLIGSDFTKEKLLHEMAKWPVATGNSAEAGGVLGGFSMGADQRRGTITTLCSLFDGQNPGQRRVGDGMSVPSGDAFLTLSLAMQPIAWQDTKKQHGNLITQIGLGPRLLLSEPPSGIGSCRYAEPPQWAHAAIKMYQDAMKGTLRCSALPTRDQEGGAQLKLRTLALDADASRQVFEFMLQTESRMAREGDLTELTGHGRRATEHVCRLAAGMTAVCSQGRAQSVSIEYTEAAIKIVNYYLAEAIRLTSACATPAMQDARRLESWLVEHGGFAVRSKLLTFGPLRDRSRLESAVAVLLGKHRARQIKTGRTIAIEINPDLTGGVLANLANSANQVSK